MKLALAFSTALIFAATAATACPYKDKILASSSGEQSQSMASAEAPASEQSQAPVEIAEDATTVNTAAVTK